MALLDVRKEIDFCRKVGVKILGVVENMSIFACPCCKVIAQTKLSNLESQIFVFQRLSEIFPATTGGARKMCEELNVPFLGNLPLDPTLARCCDEGRNFVTELPDSPAVKNLKSIIESKFGI